MNKKHNNIKALSAASKYMPEKSEITEQFYGKETEMIKTESEMVTNALRSEHDRIIQKSRLMRILVIGHSGHGKTTFTEIAQSQFNLSCMSSSLFCTKAFLYKDMKDTNESMEEFYARKDQVRDEFFKKIQNYNQPKHRLAQNILSQFSIYDGMRDQQEFNAAREKGLISLTIAIDASKRKPKENQSSMTIDIDQADMCISNNGTKAEYIEKVIKVLTYITQ